MATTRARSSCSGFDGGAVYPELTRSLFRRHTHPAEDGAMITRSLHPRRWSRLRFALGIAQMAGATLALVLLITDGLARSTIYATILTSIVTTVSVLLFGHHRSRR